MEGSETSSNSMSSTVAPSAVRSARRLLTRRKKPGRAEENDTAHGDGNKLEDVREGVAAPDERGDGSRDPGPCLL